MPSSGRDMAVPHMIEPHCCSAEQNIHKIKLVKIAAWVASPQPSLKSYWCMSGSYKI